LLCHSTERYNILNYSVHPVHHTIIGFALLLIHLFPQGAQAAECFLRGRIIDEGKQVIPGVTILVEATQKGTTTDNEGVFKMAWDQTIQSPIRISAVGYVTRSISVGIGSCPNMGDLILNASTQELRPLIVTATRSVRSLDGVSLPVTVVGQQEIRRRSTQRLGDLLSELGGLQVVNDFGLGLQLQGFDPDYTLIMIDGEPVIGRTAGTLDLNRIALADVRQIEIVKGPSSSLYGSEALAGVVNIITDRADEELRYQAATSLGSYGYSDSQGQIQFKEGKLSQTVFLNHNRSDGYDLNPSTRWATTSKTWSTSLRTNTQWNPSDKLSLRVSMRAYQEEQRNQDAFITTQRGLADVLYFATQRDGTISTEAQYQAKPDLQFALRNQASGYQTDAYYRFDSDRILFDPTSFDQAYLRPEASVVKTYDKHQMSGGLGWIYESVRSDRYLDGINRQNTQFIYLQHEWEITDRWTLLSGLRYDRPEVYDPKLSPRISTAIKRGDVTFRAAFGTGFKSPDFRHLYLDFFNAAGAYRVLGSQTAGQEIGRLLQNGSLQTDDLFLPIGELFSLKPEQSMALNAGFDYNREALSLSVNLFRNKVTDLIEYTRAALLASGQTLFTYQNINSVRLSGLELDGRWPIRANIQLGFAYQYLDSRDLEVVNDIKSGLIFRRDPNSGVVSRVRLREYGGLANRSRHSGNLSVFIKDLIKDSDLSVRAVVRGRYGFGDANGNGIIDQDLEYGRSHVNLNATFIKELGKHLDVQFKVLNALNVTDPERLLTTPGRQLQFGIRFQN
jgi:outer membrane receptor for ferrienterochelin and colicins